MQNSEQGAAEAAQCVRVVPSRLKPGTLADWLAAHRRYHTPAVRRQPGFVSKVLLQAEDDPGHVAMLLTWETSAQAIAWTKQPEHDEVSRPASEYVVRDDPARGTLQRGGYRVLDAVAGPTVGSAGPLVALPESRDPQAALIKETA
jgi:heme-degrading monooxygenase HmoA